MRLKATGGKVTCGAGYYYSETAPIFDDFVNYFFEKAIEAQRLSDSARNTFYKLVLNNLYGKFGQRDTVESLQTFTRKRTKRLERGAEINEFYRVDDSDYAFYDVKSPKRNVTHQFPCYRLYDNRKRADQT
jgi:hypothetical protein